MSILNKLYSLSPVFFQNVVVSCYGYYWKHRRYGGHFSKKIIEFRKRESFTKQQWIAYQTEALQKLLIHAFTTVPYYKNLYSNAGFKLSDFENFKIKDLSKLPFLEKDDLRKYGKTTLLSTKRKKGKFYSSSGSTGTPVQIYLSKEMHQSWSALYETRVRNWAGVNFEMPRAMIGGRRVLPRSSSKPPFFRYNKAEKQAYFSAYHISDKNIKFYIEGLKKSKSIYLIGYAMSIYLLAKSIEKGKLKAPKLKAVLTSSEKLTDEMRRIIQTVFECNVYDGYSGVEACGLISENKFGELLFSPDSGIMEVLNKEGSQVDFGASGEVVATGFLNYDQPLIKYRIGDSVKVSKDQRSKSGCEMLKIDEIEGRSEDVIIGTDGQQMVRFHSVFINITSIIMGQVIQKSRDKILIKLVVQDSYEKANEKKILERIKSQLGALEVDFLYVSKIERTKSGKFKAVISNLKNG